MTKSVEVSALTKKHRSNLRVNVHTDSLLTQGLVCAGVSTKSSVSLAEWERVVSEFRPDCAVQQGTPLVVPQEVQGEEMRKQCNWKLLGE